MPNECVRVEVSPVYVCLCRCVTDKQIRQAVDEGAYRVRDLRQELGVAAKCGKCAPHALELLREHQAMRSVPFLPGAANPVGRSPEWEMAADTP